MSNRSMTDVAYQLLSKKKNSVTFNKLWDEVSQIMGYSENVAERKIASFYTSMMLDNRFTSLGNNKWDLRSRHTYNETHFDTSAIVLEDDNNDELDELDSFEEEAEVEKVPFEETNEESLALSKIVLVREKPKQERRR
ncbi:DNA-directed RNA polymerase subunit delta, partial [Holdemania filiformis]|uniref:DNA-directed RNA polymerase subunit delta n=1 Tax=Holdemania filiformis TaxID=61171 RepID=UPI00210C513E|nr:DNA-directed RNA polymerase subunit delta [Holdemania filiformis]